MKQENRSHERELIEEAQKIKDIVNISQKAKRKRALKMVFASGLGLIPFLSKLKTAYRIPTSKGNIYSFKLQG